MPKFRTQYDEHKHYHCNCGKRTKDEFCLGYDDEGCQCLVKTGETDLYEYIQSHKDGCDLATILSRLDPTQVNAMMSTYDYDDLTKSPILNMTELPKNPGEMLNLMKMGQNLFDGLPVDIREAFNFSHEKFFSEIGTESFKNKIDFLNGQRMANMTIPQKAQSKKSKENTKEKGVKENGE